MRNVERGEIGADHVHHRVDGRDPHGLEPFALGLFTQRIAVFAGEALADRDEIVAGIEAFGNFADVFAERFAVAQMRGAREHIDLRAGVIDVIFARDAVARKFQQARQRIAEHRAAAVADMHRASRVGGDILDVDPLRLAHPALRGAAEILALLERGAQHGGKDVRLEADVDEAGAGDLGLRYILVLSQSEGDFGRELARRAEAGLGLLGENHRGIDREIAQRSLARGFDHETAHVEVGRQAARLDEPLQDRGDAGVEIGENVHGAPD